MRGALIKISDEFVVELLRHCTDLPCDVEVHRSQAEHGVFSIVVKSEEFEEIPECGQYPYLGLNIDVEKVRGWFGLDNKE